MFHEQNFDLLPSRLNLKLEVEIDRFLFAQSRELIKKLFVLAHMLLNDKQFSYSLLSCFSRTVSLQKFLSHSSRKQEIVISKPGEALFLSLSLSKFQRRKFIRSVSRYVGNLVFLQNESFHKRKFDTSRLPEM